MRQLIPLLLLLTISTTAFSQISDREKVCIKAENLAKKDMYNKELKYYTFGLMPAIEPQDEIRKKILKEKYNLTLMHLGCVVSDSELCYNEMAEKLLLRKYGNDFWDDVQKQVDSALATQKQVSVDTKVTFAKVPKGYEPAYASTIRAEEEGAEKARKDNKKGKLVIHKYYDKKVNNADVEILNRVLQDQYGYQFKPITGVVPEETVGYRREATKIAKEKYGHDFWQQLNKKADSMRIEQEPFGDRIR